jgi:Kef-type K+ transport system membrane component KefB
VGENPPKLLQRNILKEGVFMTHEQMLIILLHLSIALMAGLFFSRLAKLINLPAVTAYLIAGVLIGPFILGALGTKLSLPWLGFAGESVDSYSIISEVALGFIAFSIGNEFRMSDLKSIGKQAAVIGVLQAVITTVVVDIGLVALHLILGDKFPLPAAIVLGAVASATAPAATLMVVRQYKAKGPVTNILLPIVALDDAVGLVIFAVSFGIARAVSVGDIDPVSIIVNPILEIVLSLALGIVLGLLFTISERFFHSRSKRLAVSVTFVLLAVAISLYEHEFANGLHITFSPLLVCMMLGTVFCNTCDFSEELMGRIDRWTAPLFILFFVISGAELKLNVFGDWVIVLVGVIYIATRSIGKCSGATLSSGLMKCDKNIIKYLGITLLPQAGVALGMANMAVSSPDLGESGAIVQNITLFAVLIYEIVGPLLTKIALTKAGEIKPHERKSARGARVHDHHIESGEKI